MFSLRFCTSKCHGLTDLDHLSHFGYRGEALASIRDVCGVLEITTRTRSSSKTFCKLFQQGKGLKGRLTVLIVKISAVTQQYLNSAV